MRNWKTTLAGLATGLPFLIDALMQAYTAGYFTDKSGWQLFGSIAWIIIAKLAKDDYFTGTKNSIIGGSTPPSNKDEK